MWIYDNIKETSKIVSIGDTEIICDNRQMNLLKNDGINIIIELRFFTSKKRNG